MNTSYFRRPTRRKRAAAAVTAALAALALVALLPTAARAHYLWATVENGQVRFALLDDAATAPKPEFASYVAALAPRGDQGRNLTLGAPKDGARYAALPAGTGVVAAESVVGVRERGAAPYLLVYHPRGAASVAAAGAKSDAAAELRAARDGDTLVVTAWQGGWPVPAAEIWVQWPGEAAPTGYTADLKGEVRTPWKATTAPGFVGVRVLVTEKKAGVHEGKTYAAVHRWATLTFPASPAAAEAKPFTRVLREAYGDKHEVVSNAAFNKTLFEGALTKPMLEVHLQQRALIHDAVHRILTAADPGEKTLPYGPEQKKLLTLLRADLTDMGSGWPTDAEARPATKAFLAELRASEAKGPYFALGVHHVYYGGTTNGGRSIGQKIADTLQISPTYYRDSDGYADYVARVNATVTDTAARAEMIRGGQAAYAYIIASMNEDVFKTASAAK